MSKNIAAIILAAGRGERMKSDLVKVLHSLCGRPMLGYVLDCVNELKINKAIAVLGHKHAEIRRLLNPRIKIVIQKRLQGSADAVRQTQSVLKKFPGIVLVLYADNPLLKKDTLKKLLQYHRDNEPEVTLLTAKVKNPSGYGRILRDKYASISRIVEEKDADSFQKDIKEINIGCACFNAQKLFAALKKVRRNNRKKEYYLTDVIEIIYKEGGRVESVKLLDPTEGQGINSRSDLAKANRIMQARIIQEHLENGVGVVDPQTTFIDWGVAIGVDTRIYPFTVIERDVKIGKRCSIGPFAHLRPGTTIEGESVVGNFVELVRCKVSRYTLAKHFCYLGDTKVGSNVNIGAGVVTANFDGKKKHTSIIKDKAFLGCDTVLVAPVKIGKGAVTGAGAVVPKNKNVADHTVVVGMPARVIKKRG